MSLLKFINKKTKAMTEEVKNALNEAENVEETNEVNTPTVSDESSNEVAAQEEREEKENIAPEKTLIVIQWDGLNRATSEFEFLDNFEGATVWIFSKKPLESLPEKFQNFNVELFPMPEYEKSLQNFLLSTTLFSLFIDDPGRFEKVVFVSAHQYFEGIAYVLSQRGVSAEAVVYLLPEKSSRGSSRARVSRRRFSRRISNRRTRGRRRSITVRDAEKIREAMIRNFRPGQIYSVKDFSNLVSRVTRKRFADLFGVSSIGPFIRMLKDNSCVEEVSEKDLKYIEAPTLRMILNSPKYRRRFLTNSQETSENSNETTGENNSTNQESNELNVMDEISNL